MSKICVLCGRDVAAEKRLKDSQGRYYCAPCAAKQEERARRAAQREPEDGQLELAPREEAPRVREIGRGASALMPAGGAAARAAGPPCPSCDRVLGAGAKICVECGIRVPSGKPMITALGRDENLLYSNTETIIRALSWILWLGLYPIASEAYATKKPIVTWIIAIVTTIVSVGFFITLRADGDHETALHLMLWPPARQVSEDAAASFYHKHEHDDTGEMLRQMGKAVSSDPNVTDEQAAIAAVRQIMAHHAQGEFRWYQLLTNIFLHDPSSVFGLIMHLAGNMLFLLIFGTRVNALIGNLKMAILYPVLGILASGAYVLFDARSGAPALGASGAIMGLAGMYLVFFPVHRVYMAFWLKIFWRIPTWIKIWPMRGFWVLAIYLGFDVVSTLLRAQDGVAHWAHVGGFFAGVVIATAMLIGRLERSHGDLLSVLLGKHSWPLIGKPPRAAHAGVVRL